MPSKFTQASLWAVLIGASQLAAASFTIDREGEVVVPAPTEKHSTPPKTNVAIGSQGGRNIDPSAPVDKITKGNRQRIDLESRLSTRIMQSGVSPQALQTLRGLGRQVTFEDALRQILPAGWSVFSDQEAPLDKLVNWQGGRTWPMVLNSVLTDMNMRAHINWDAQELMLFVPAAKETVAVAQLVAPDARDASAQPSSNSPNSATTTQEVVWFIKPGNLRENLRVLADKAGWTLVWSAVDGDAVINYEVEAPGYQLTGPLIGASGVIAKVVDLYAQAERPLAVTFWYGNKVVEIRLHGVKSDSKASAISKN
jgi:hypothetical protein